MQDLNIAVVQTQQFWEDKESNLEHFENKFLKQLEGQKLDLVLLPEMFNTSFSMNVEKLAESMEGPSIGWLKQRAQRLDCQIGGSLIIEEAGRYYNRFVIVSAEGVVASYDKRHLFRMAKENEHFSAGEERIIYALNGWNILLQVCYDLRFPVFSRNKTIGDKKEYDLMLYVANWPEKRNMVWKTLLQARAMENQAFCIGVNRVGVDGNDIIYSGDSMLVDPWGKVQHQFSENEEKVKILTLDYEHITDITNRFPAYKDAD